MLPMKLILEGLPIDWLVYFLEGRNPGGIPVTQNSESQFIQGRITELWVLSHLINILGDSLLREVNDLLNFFNEYGFKTSSC